MKRFHLFTLIACAFALFVVCDSRTGRAETYEYEVDGRLLRVTYDDGSAIHYHYDLNGNMLACTVSVSGSFHRGDPNRDGRVDVSDGVFVFFFLFGGAQVSLSCRESADANNNGVIDVTDGIYLLNYIFLDGVPPATPGPPGAPCGLDTDLAGSAGDLGCDLYDQCGGGR